MPLTPMAGPVDQAEGRLPARQMDGHVSCDQKMIRIDAGSRRDLSERVLPEDNHSPASVEAACSNDGAGGGCEGKPGGGDRTSLNKEDVEEDGEEKVQDGKANGTTSGEEVLGLEASMRLYKSLYFMSYAAIAFYIPFLPLFLQSIGLGFVAVGTVLAARPFIGILCAPLWGGVADASQQHRRVLCAVMTSAALLRVLMLLLSLPASAPSTPPARTPTATDVAPEGGGGGGSAELSTQETQAMVAGTGAGGAESGAVVGWVVAALFASDFFGQAVEPLCDATTLLVLPNPSLYPKVRLWGSVGWGWVGAPLAGYLLESTDISALFVVHTVFVVSALAVICLLPHGAPTPTPIPTPTSPPPSPGPASSPGALLLAFTVMTRTNYALIFYLGSLVLGLGYGAIGSFTFLLLRAIGDAGRMMGLSLLVGCVTEVTCFLVADKAIARLGHLAVMTGCVLLMGVRMLGLAALQHPSQVLLVETLAGPIFALGWTAGVTFSRQIAPEGHGATMIGIYTGLKFGVGCGLGSLLAGPLTNSLGLRGMFVVLGVFSMLVAAAMVVAAVVAERVGVLGVGAGMPGPSGSRAKWSHEQHQWFELEDRAEGTLLGWRPEEGGGEGEKAAAGAVTKCSEIKPEV